MTNLNYTIQYKTQLMSAQNLVRIKPVAFCHKTVLLSHIPVFSDSSGHMVAEKHGKPDMDSEGMHANH